MNDRMEVVLSNKITIRGIPDSLKSTLIRQLTIANPKYATAKKQGYSTWGIDQFIYNFSVLSDDEIEIPRGMRKQLFFMIDEMGIETTTKDNRVLFPSRFDIDSSAIVYRPYQMKAIEKISTGDPEGVIVAPPGSGKTVMMLSLIPLFGGQPTLWLTHTYPLARQVLDRAKMFLPSLRKSDIGFIGGGKVEIGNVFTIALVQTLIRRPEETRDLQNSFGMIMIDECHHLPSTTFTMIVNQFAANYIFGFTATPFRRDGLETLLFQNIGKTITTITTEEVERDGGIMLPTVRYKSVHSKRIESSNVQKILKENIVENNKRNNLIAGDVIEEAVKGHYCIIISDRKIHCEILYSLIRKGWDKTGIATGDYSKKKVMEQIKRLQGGEITVIITTSTMLGEGFDFAPLSRGFVAMPFRSEGKAVQILGRIDRPAEGKEDAILIDYVDSSIGVLQDQFSSKYGKCRFKAYKKMGAHVEPY